jgi:hypothetical protein
MVIQLQKEKSSGGLNRLLAKITAMLYVLPQF